MCVKFENRKFISDVFSVFAGEIVAISLGVACLILVLGALVYWAWKLARRRRALNSEYEKILPTKQQQQQQQQHIMAPTGEKTHAHAHPDKAPPTLR